MRGSFRLGICGLKPQIFGRETRAVRPWHPWCGHSLLQGCRGRREGVFRVLADVSGIGGECFSWMGGGAAVW
jgi:hypothetical protein